MVLHKANRGESAATPDFFYFAGLLCRNLTHMGQLRKAERYTTVINSFKRFRHNRRTPLGVIDSVLVQKYEASLICKGLCKNTVSFYLRGLRCIYNRAIDSGLIPYSNPFRNVYTGIDKTVKRALPLSIMRDIKALDLSGSPSLAFARDIFLFAFYMRGMSFVDIAYLLKSNLSGNMIIYRRHKTGQQLQIRWERQMQEIVERYDRPRSPYMLPIIRDPYGDDYRQYKTMAHNVNENLKKIGKLLNLPMPLTSYVARHSWASIARNQDIPISTISEAMGHDSEKTTRIYLSSVDTTRVDRANEKVINLL